MQLAAQIPGVGILNEAADHFISNRYDFRLQENVVVFKHESSIQSLQQILK